MKRDSQKYLYAVLEAGRPIGLGTIGVDGEAVTSIHKNGLACVVSDARQEEYIANQAILSAHEKVLERLTREHTLLPIRFGSVAESTKEVERFLEKNTQRLRQSIEKIKGKLEVEIEISWKDMPVIYKEIVASNKKLQYAKATRKKQNRETLIMVGQLVHALLAQKKEQESQRYVKALKPVSVDHVLNPCHADEMVMNASFLVASSQVKEFDRVLDELEGKLRERIRVKYIGPLPPYSFVHMRIHG